MRIFSARLVSPAFVLGMFLGLLGFIQAHAFEGKWEVAVKGESLIRFRAELLGFGEAEVRLRAVRGGEVVDIEIPMVSLQSVRRLPSDGSALEKSQKENRKRPAPLDIPGFYLELRDGARIGGRLVSFGEEEVEFESDLFGNLRVPVAAIVSIARGDQAFPAPKKKIDDQGYRVALENGEVVQGELKADGKENWLSISGPNASARFPHYLIGRIDFPEVAPPESSESDFKELFEIQVSGGDTFLCRLPKIENRQLVATARGKFEIRLGMDDVESIVPKLGGRLPVNGGALVWSGFSNKETLEPLKRSLGLAGLRTSEIAEQLPPGDAFRDRLLSQRVFLIPVLSELKAETYETELKSGSDSMGVRLYLRNVMRPAIQTFLEKGGHVVCAGIARHHFEFLKEIGAGSGIEISGETKGGQWPIRPEYLELIGGKFGKITFSETGYLYSAESWEWWGGSAKASPVISKSFGDGRLTIIGADFATSNTELERFLSAVLKLR